MTEFENPGFEEDDIQMSDLFDEEWEDTVDDTNSGAVAETDFGGGTITKQARQDPPPAHRQDTPSTETISESDRNRIEDLTQKLDALRSDRSSTNEAAVKAVQEQLGELFQSYVKKLY